MDARGTRTFKATRDMLFDVDPFFSRVYYSTYWLPSQSLFRLRSICKMGNTTAFREGIALP